MKYGTGLQYFCEKYRERFFDVGIAEEHAVTFSAGLASMGFIPVFAVYSTFLQRAYDQLMHDVSISGVHVVLGIDRAGIVGEDGETTVGDFLAVSEDAAPESRALMNALSEDMRKALSTLTERERTVICMRFGLFDGRERTLEEVGESFLVTRERIRQIEAKALRKLRHPARARYLQEYAAR